MKILIRHPLTKEYRTRSGSWTRRPEEAEVFGGSAEAVKVCISERLEAYEVLMRHSSDSRYDILLVEQVKGGGNGGQVHRGDTETRRLQSRQGEG
jgi:hypothetical protein